MANKGTNKNENPSNTGAARHSSTNFVAPPAGETNHDHPSQSGTRGTVPGEGIVHSGADANPDELSPAGRVAGAPGAGPCDAPQTAPGAKRPEALNPPDDSDIPRPLSEELPGIADPNFPTDRNRPKDRDM
jgi:hypothetical protein